LQRVNCYSCSSNQNTFYATENGFNLVKCSECGLLFVNPRPDDITITQAHMVGVHRGIKDLSVTGIFQCAKINRYLLILGKFFEDSSSLDGKEWLDIGCGYGEFLLALKKFTSRKIVVKGIEPNIAKQKSAIKKGLDVCYFDLGLHKKKYDIISFLNVYSHLPDPVSFILSCRELLKPDGELLIETGDTADLISEDHYRPFYLPDHLSFASESIVVSILERSGFEVVNIKKYPYMKWNWISFFKEFAKIFWPNTKSQLGMFFKQKTYANADMFIRARLKS
jgi:SAM-dependent methyltransferase